MKSTNEYVVQALMKVLNIDNANQINNDSNLKDDLGLDSMSSLTFLMTLEELVSGFIVDPDTLDSDDLLTVASVSNYIERQLKATTINAA